MEAVHPREGWERCIVAASGPSLTEEAAAAIMASGLPVLAVNDAYRRVPTADVLYACDGPWWHERHGAKEFHGERWSSIGRPGRFRHNDKSREQRLYGMRLIFGEDKPGFSFNPELIHYGSNSGFQGVNLALLMGAKHIVLVGYDMQGTHFFGPHRQPLRNTSCYASFIRAFEVASRRLPASVRIINASPSSKLGCFPKVAIHVALAEIASSHLADHGEPLPAVALAG